MLDKFTKLEENIYQVNDVLENPSLPVLIAVHPYFGEGRKSSFTGKSPEEYCSNRDKILKRWSGKGNVVFFESFHDYWLSNFQERVVPVFQNGLYLVQQPLHLRDVFERDFFPNYANFLKNLGDKFLFIGGGFYKYINPYTWERELGDECLNGTVRSLARRGIKGSIIGDAVYPTPQNEELFKKELIWSGWVEKHGAPWERKSDNGHSKALKQREVK